MASVQITHICFERDKELANETRISLHSVFILMHCEIPGKVILVGKYSSVAVREQRTYTTLWFLRQILCMVVVVI